jgi:hypothetical protein
MQLHRIFTRGAKVIVFDDCSAEIELADGTQIVGDGSGRRFTEQEALEVVDEIENLCRKRQAAMN